MNPITTTTGECIQSKCLLPCHIQTALKNISRCSTHVIFFNASMHEHDNERHNPHALPYTIAMAHTPKQTRR